MKRIEYRNGKEEKKSKKSIIDRRLTSLLLEE